MFQEQATTLGNLGNTAYAQKQYELAIAYYDQALMIDPDYAAIFHNRGLAFFQLMQFESALASYQQALRINANYTDAYLNAGNVLRCLNQLEKAVDYYNHAIRLQPSLIKAYSNKGVALYELRRVDEAIASFYEALQMDPEHYSSNWNLSHCYLLQGDFERGLPLFEWRLKDLEFKNTVFSQALEAEHLSSLKGIEGKRVLLTAEQGLGDTVQFSRYVSDLAKLGAHIYLEVPKPLVRLMESLDAVTQVIAKGDPLPQVDAYASLMSMPWLFQTRLHSIPSSPNYLHAPSQKIASWNPAFEHHPQLKVGIVWSGGARPNLSDGWATHRRRNIDFEYWKWIDLEGITIVNLQKGEPASSQWNAAFFENAQTMNLIDQCDDFADTAALISQLDLVISVDTSTPHVAAAIGKPVWLLSRLDGCWRWMEDLQESPWYPSLSIYRQSIAFDWTSVMQKVRRDLIQFRDAHSAQMHRQGALSKDS